MTHIECTVPYLTDIQAVNQPLSLWHAHWRGLVETAFQIRQKVSEPINRGGLDFLLMQYENTKRGVETLRGQVQSKRFLKDKKAGVDEWIKWLCTIINDKIAGFKQIEKITLVRLPTTEFLAYYGPFFSNQMEIILYIGSREDTDGATVIHRERSEVDMTTRNWDLLSEYLPQTVLINETKRR